MASTVEEYLAQLKGRLSSADPALVQDALYDAEEYLRSALAEAGGEPEAFARVVESYGTPEEIAAAYRDVEMTVSKALRKPAPASTKTGWGRFFGVVADAEAWGALFYMLLTLVTGILYFTVVVTGLSLTFGLAILIVGVPFALLFLAVVRAVSLAEGRVVEGLLGVRMPRRPRMLAARGDIVTRVKSWFTDVRTWTTMLYMALQLPLGTIYFSSVVTFLAVSTWLVVGPIAQLAFDVPIARSFEYGYFLDPWAIPLVMAGGVLGFVLTLWLAKGVGRLHGAYAKAMLVGRAGEE
ncbi:MAG: sensor domain-containing protein [Coriobacteriia bacterium]